MINLIPFCKTDYALLISWVDSEELLMQFAGPVLTYPLTTEQLDLSLTNKRRMAFKVTDTQHKAIGYAEIYLTEKTACLSRLIIGNPQLRGKGYGRQLVNKLLNYTFLELHQSMAELNVFDWNIAAVKCYEKAGFVLNPNKKMERKIKDQTWIAVNMTLSKKRWLQLNPDGLPNR